MNQKSTDYQHDPPKSQKKLKDTNMRWFFLLLICLLNFGNYYTHDTLGVLQKVVDQDFDIDTFKFNLIYSVYSYPNVLLAFCGGFMIDYFGVRVSALLVSIILILGQAVITIGVYQINFGIVIMGRVLFGMGAETLSSAQTVLNVKWFMGKELAFSLGLTLCIARLGSSLNSFLTPHIYDWTNLYIPFVIGLGIAFLSALTLIPIWILDKKADQQEEKVIEVETERMSLKDLKSFRLIYYLLVLNCIFLYGAYFGLMNNISDLMQQRFGFDQSSAGTFITIIYLSAAVLTPISGYIVDKFGRRVTLMIAASFIFMFTHLFIAFLPDRSPGDPNYWMVLGLIGVGLFYSVYASIFWPCVPLIVDPKVKGTAYGFIFSLQNAMQGTVPLIVGAINSASIDYHFGYFWTEIFLAGLVVCGIIVTTMIYFEDKRTGRRLEGVTKPPDAKIFEEIKEVSNYVKMVDTSK